MRQDVLGFGHFAADAVDLISKLASKVVDGKLAVSELAAPSSSMVFELPVSVLSVSSGSNSKFPISVLMVFDLTGRPPFPWRVCEVRVPELAAELVVGELSAEPAVV